ncbi:MAG TPA: hypothetical protein VN952_04095 [Chthoniobacterales bacterium]|nr:hypothetical protein [Chthoniobacterales bacterium]
MSTVGTLVRDPGIVWLPIASSAVAILRGQLVTIDGTTHTAKVAGVVGDRVVGVALSDADPDLLSVAVGCKGGYTISMVPKSGDTFFIGTIVNQDQTTFSQVTVTVTAGKEVGWVVNPQKDSLGNLEIAFFLF